ncbi:MAG: hypothetical protein K8T89_23795 [Planctomycetes bacterium]|nr:hypothetical protein [Planctomycetota bacterium]
MATATAARRATDQFFTDDFQNLVTPPKGERWFHNMPLPNGDRLAGANPDRAREQKLWRYTVDAFGLDLQGLRVLDIGANDGLFTIASLLRGAEHVTAINPADINTGTYPRNLNKACEWWDVHPGRLPANTPTASPRRRGFSGNTSHHGRASAAGVRTRQRSRSHHRAAVQATGRYLWE